MSFPAGHRLDDITCKGGSIQGNRREIPGEINYLRQKCENKSLCCCFLVVFISDEFNDSIDNVLINKKQKLVYLIEDINTNILNEDVNPLTNDCLFITFGNLKPGKAQY